MRTIHFDFTPIYIVANSSKEAADRLYPGTVGDLDNGDAVLVFVRQDEESGEIDGNVLITGFSRDTVVSPPRGRPSDWIFKAIGFGGPGIDQ